jgi:transporter family-2 protein
MNISILFPLLAIVAGTMTAFQPLVNAKLNGQVSSPLWAAFISFAVGATILFILAWATSGKFLSIETAGLKWWMFLGGALGAFFVTTALFIVPHLGVATMIALFVAGQLISSALLDHYGFLAAAPNPINVQKLIGLILLAVGAFITLKA